jgi:uncharacterized protein
VTRLIVIAVVVFAVIWLLRRAISGPGPRRDEAQGATPQGDLVSCAQCGVNLPKAEAYAARGVPSGAGGRFYCSEEHSRLGPREG